MKKYLTLLPIMLLVASTTYSSMQLHEFCIDYFTQHTKLHEYCIDYFTRYWINTEHQAYLCLKQYPLQRDINYVAVPWVALLKRRALDLLPDITLNSGCTVCADIHFERLFPLFKKMGIDTIFTPHAEEKKQCEGLTIVPFSHYAYNGCPPAKHKDILYSFIGRNTKNSVRGQIAHMPNPPDTIIILKPKDTPGGEQAKKEFRETLSRSRFSLCPRGTGPSTIRFWESLQAGAIPILLADAMLLPEGFDWDTCIIRVPEKDLMKVDSIVRNINPDNEAYMRQECLRAYQQFSGENFASVIRNFYDA